MDFIVQFGALTEVQTRFWARQICLAVQYLHTLGNFRHFLRKFLRIDLLGHASLAVCYKVLKAMF